MLEDSLISTRMRRAEKGCIASFHFVCPPVLRHSSESICRHLWDFRNPLISWTGLMHVVAGHRTWSNQRAMCFSISMKSTCPTCVSLIVLLVSRNPAL
jgi:hypothetical protein